MLKKSLAILLAALCLLLCCCNKEVPVTYDTNAGLWYYDHLNEEQKQIYTKARNAAENMQLGLIELGSCSQQDVILSCRALLSDRPDLFWLPESFIFQKDEDGTYIAFEYESHTYLMPSGQLRNAKTLLDSAIVEINKGITPDMSDFDKELYYHNWLCQNVEYADSTENNMVYTAYGALVNGSAVCEGYSRAMQLLCQSQKLDCHVVYGSAAGVDENYIGHMWNQIKLEGRYYNLDVTLDDGKELGYDFFNLTDLEITKTHAFDKDFSRLTAEEIQSGSISFNLSLPACSAQKYNYYSVFPKE